MGAAWSCGPMKVCRPIAACSRAFREIGSTIGSPSRWPAAARGGKARRCYASNGRKRSAPRVLKAEPNEEGVDRQDDAHKQQPPDAEVFQPTATPLFFGRQRGIFGRPDDAFSLLRRGSRGKP